MVSPDTSKRVFSALVLIILLFIAYFIGPKGFIGLSFFIGLILADEVYCNFCKNERFGFQYFLAQVTFGLSYILLHLESPPYPAGQIVIFLSVLLNIVLCIYLFSDQPHPLFYPKLLLFPKIRSVLCGLIVLFSVYAFSFLLFLQQWEMYLTLLLVVNFSMDTGAWFFGKKFGRHKLWKKISPKKNVEGLFGGMISAAVIGSALWMFFQRPFSIAVPLLLLLLALVSHLGDFIQSKLKRQCSIKDSSSLIPGHGGVYDRVDGLIYATPFYLVVLHILFHS